MHFQAAFKVACFVPFAFGIVVFGAGRLFSRVGLQPGTGCMIVRRLMMRGAPAGARFARQP